MEWYLEPQLSSQVWKNHAAHGGMKIGNLI